MGKVIVPDIYFFIFAAVSCSIATLVSYAWETKKTKSNLTREASTRTIVCSGKIDERTNSAFSYPTIWLLVLYCLAGTLFAAFSSLVADHERAGYVVFSLSCLLLFTAGLISTHIRYTRTPQCIFTPDTLILYGFHGLGKRSEFELAELSRECIYSSRGDRIRLYRQDRLVATVLIKEYTEYATLLEQFLRLPEHRPGSR